jgi:hypothetical protein
VIEDGEKKKVRSDNLYIRSLMHKAMRMWKIYIDMVRKENETRERDMLEIADAFYKKRCLLCVHFLVWKEDYMHVCSKEKMIAETKYQSSLKCRMFKEWREPASETRKEKVVSELLNMKKADEYYCVYLKRKAFRLLVECVEEEKARKETEKATEDAEEKIKKWLNEFRAMKQQGKKKFG